MDSNKKTTLFFFIFFFIIATAMSYFNNEDFGAKNILASFLGAVVGSLVFYFFNRMSHKKKSN